MTWLTPTIGAVAAAVAIPTLLILYFLKLRRRDLEVSTTLLWKKSIQDLQANAPFQKLRRNILLLLQLLALAAALTALAQPQVRAAAATGKRHILLIDRSASMSALDGDPDLAPGAAGQRTRLDQAKRKAFEIIDALREPSFLAGDDSGDQAMVIAFDAAGEVRQNFTASKADLKRAVESITPSDSPSSIADAFKLAKAYVPRAAVEGYGFIPIGDPAVIHFLTDGRLPDIDQVAPDPGELGDTVVYHAVGAEVAPNIGVTSLRADRAFDNPGRLTIFVGLQSTDRSPRTVDVELSIDNAVAAIRQVSFPAAAPRPGVTAPSSPEAGDDAKPSTEVEPRTGGVVFSLDRPQGGVAAVRIRNPDTGARLDPLPVDDIAYLVLPPARRLSVALVTTGNLFLREALEGMNLSRLSILPPAAFQRMAAGEQVNALGMGDFDVFILDRALPQAAAAEDAAAGALPPGRFLILGAVPPPPLGPVDEGEGEPAIMIDWARDHPALKYAGLAELIIAKSRRVTVPDGAPITVIAHDQHGPAILEAATDATRALIVPFDIADSDWPLKPGFVLFLASALPYLADDGSLGVGRLLRPGQTLTERLPLGASDVRVAPPETGAAPQTLFPAADGRVAYGPLRRIGIYTLSWVGPASGADTLADGRARRAVAVNLLDAAESNIDARPALDLATETVAAQGRDETQAVRNLWPWLLLAALGIIMLEWFVYNRKVHI